MTFNSIMEKFYAEDPKMILDALEELSQGENQKNNSELPCRRWLWG